MGGHVRVDEDDRVLEICLDKLYKQDIWWLVVYFDEGEARYTYFQSSAHVKSLAKFVRDLIENNIPHLVFAIWHGRRRTDAFLIDYRKIIERFGV